MSFSVSAPLICAPSGHSASLHRDDPEVEGSLLFDAIRQNPGSLASLIFYQSFATLYATPTPIRANDLAAAIDVEPGELLDVLPHSPWFVIRGDLVSLAMDEKGGHC